MCGDESVWPKRNSALVQAALNLCGWRFKNAATRDGHLKYSVHASKPGEHAFSDFADELHGNAAGFTFRRNAVCGESCRAQFAFERWRAWAVGDNFYFFRALVDVLKISVIDALLAEFCEQEYGQRRV